MRLYHVKDAVKEAVRLSLFLYGSSGAGKTHFCGSFGAVKEMSPVLLIDTDGGARTVVEAARVRGLEWDVVIVDQIDSAKDLEKALLIDKTKDGREIKTVVIDSLSAFQFLDLLTMVKARGGERPEIQEYGTSTFHLNELALAASQAGVHFVVTATERLEDAVLVPALTSAASKQVPAKFDLVAYLTLQQRRVGREIVNQRVLKLEPTPTVRAKSRYVLPPEIVEPTGAELWRLLNASSKQRKKYLEENKKQKGKSNGG